MWEALHQMPTGEAFWICRFPVCPLRAEPNHRSEMVSQLLWGEPQDILIVEKNWILVRGLLDGYVGWVPAGTLIRTFRTSLGWAMVRVRWASLYREKRLHGYVPVGALMPRDGIWHTAQGRFRVAQGHLLPWPERPRRVSVGRVADLFRQSPYLWGGKSPHGIDCSGLVQIAYRLAGWLLPRDAADQAAFATPTPAAQPGDLVFYTSSSSHQISHVSLYRGPRTVLHATPAAGVTLVPPAAFTHAFHSQRTLLDKHFVI